MPNTPQPVHTVSPSTTRSTPTHEVLRRIRVRDPNSKNSLGYHRRMEDFEFHWRTPEVTGVAIFAVILSGLLSMPLWEPVTTPGGGESLQPSMAISPSMEMPLSIPQGLHPRPQSLRRPTTPTTAAPTPQAEQEIAPEDFHVHMLGPRSFEFEWSPISDGYRYVLYRASTPTLEDAQPVLKQAVPSTSVLWNPDESVQDGWVAVKAFDAKGHETSFSQPIRVQMPPA